MLWQRFMRPGRVVPMECSPARVYSPDKIFKNINFLNFNKITRVENVNLAELQIFLFCTEKKIFP